MCRRGAREGNQVRSRLAGGGKELRTLGLRDGGIVPSRAASCTELHCSRGTEGSNPASSRDESANLRSPGTHYTATDHAAPLAAADHQRPPGHGDHRMGRRLPISSASASMILSGVARCNSRARPLHSLDGLVGVVEQTGPGRGLRWRGLSRGAARRRTGPHQRQLL